MDKGLFLRVWGIYQDHWGREEQRALRRVAAANLLHTQFRLSPKMRALTSLRRLLLTMWGMEMFVEKDEVLCAVRDMAEACMGEDHDEAFRNTMDPVARMRNGVHLPYKERCQDIYNREYGHIRDFHNLCHRHHNPPRVLVFLPSPNQSIYRVSAIVALP
jgi:hypothetical protein